MPANKRPRRERTDDWQHIQQYSLWPEQRTYDLLANTILRSAPEEAQTCDTATAIV
ncbi:hypothetical protein KSF_065700 [Reticulibacter mediterranei]|uniref:Uncharacterized protein n=1 Tax=Reticulibacter mediterranei TaxID=2778369 RepID=A0A8J3ITI0_9CHLR|nr:hypothetical protein [Reticulibacter mediterranei]GHO96522.1 hypothetical protein KSF_065700 [Reticulibacter mediterranei]